jgi:hypothetical protein
VRFTVRQNDFDDAFRFEAGRQGAQVKRGDRRVAHDQHVARRDMLSQKIGLVEQSLADQDRIATTA